ncbi:MAG: hypothetical protein DME30_12095 [Verrucomicrobia bacterium]|nr:MAG: hypothetical protein DME30_12095 [Verrucomicrobiota bacterium]
MRNWLRRGCCRYSFVYTAASVLLKHRSRPRLAGRVQSLRRFIARCGEVGNLRESKCGLAFQQDQT